MDAKELVECLKYNRERLIDERGADFSGVKALDECVELLDNIKEDIDLLPSELTADGRRMIRKVNVLKVIDKYMA